MASPHQPSTPDAQPHHNASQQAPMLTTSGGAHQHGHGHDVAALAMHAAVPQLDNQHTGQDQQASASGHAGDQQDQHHEQAGDATGEEGAGDVGSAAEEQRPCCSGHGSAEGEAGGAIASPSQPSTAPDLSQSATAAAATATRSAQGSAGKGQTSSKGGRGPNRVLPLLLLGAVAVPALAWLRKRLAEGRQGGDGGGGSARSGAAIVPGSGKKHKLLPVPAALAPPAPPPAPFGPLPLASLRLVASEDVDIMGVHTTFGLSHLPTLPNAPSDPVPSPAPAAATAPALSRLVSAGAACIGKVAVQPLSQELVGANVGTPLNRYRCAGGGSTGAALAVATGTADLALCPDSAGEARVPAACCGLYALRPTPGTLGLARAAASTSSGADEGSGAAAAGTEGGAAHGAADGKSGVLPQGLALLARDTATLTKAADVMKLPGSANLRGEILKFVVAQDLFELCAPELQPATLAVKKAILRWAGAEQAGAVQLVQFLASNTSAWVEVEAAVKRQAEARGAQGQGDKEQDKEAERDAMLHPFIRAAVAAAQALSVEEQWRGLSQGERAWLSALTSPTSPAGDSGAAANDDAVTGAAASADAAKAAAAEANGGSAHGDGEHHGSGEPSGDARKDNRATAAATPAVPPTVAALARPSPELVKASVALAREVADVLRQTVKPDTLLVLPALPFAPPRRPFAKQPASPDAASGLDPAVALALDPASVVGDDPGEYAIFSKLVRCFHAFASLGGCPSLTCPVGTLRDGSPVAITVVGVAKWDQRLLAAAGKLVPMIHDCFRAVKEEITAMAVAERQQAAAAAAAAVVGGSASKASGSLPSAPPASASRGTAAGAGSNAAAAQGSSRASNSGSVSSTGATAGSSGSAASSSSSLSAAVDPKRVEKAEKFKAKGNQLYSAGKYLEAVTEYTKAINAHPHSPVYFNNRAMACIKLFRFEQAEEDCCKALSFPDLPEKDRVKALLRRATARDALQRPDDAERDLKEVLRLEPGNRQAREDLVALRRHKEEMGAATAAMVQAMRSAGGTPGAGVGPNADRARAAAALAAAGLLPPGFDPSMLPPGLDAAAMLPPGFDPSQLAYSGEEGAGY